MLLVGIKYLCIEIHNVKTWVQFIAIMYANVYANNYCAYIFAVVLETCIN